jgi:hypothetical protein
MAAKAISPQLMQENRERAVALMGDSLRGVFETIETQLDSMKAQNILNFWNIGKQLQDITTFPERYATADNSDPMKTIIKALSWQERQARCALQFFRCYTEESLQKLLELKNPGTGFRLHFGHVRYLLTVESPDLRDSYAERAVTDCLTPEQLHKLIQTTEDREPSHGRTSVLPKTLTGQLLQIVDASQKFVNKQEQVWNGENVSVFANLTNAEDNELCHEHLDLLRALQELMQRMQRYTADNYIRCGELLTELTEKIEARDKQSADQNAEIAADLMHRTDRYISA